MTREAADSLSLRRRRGHDRPLTTVVKVVYLSAAAIPSRTANSIKVMRMCEAMAQEVTT